MFTVFTKIRKHFHKVKNKNKIVGIRKLEVTYNFIKNNYHPHFHLIVDGENVAKEIVNEWLKLYKGTSVKAQDYRKANMNSIVELFKYFTKMFTKQGVNIKSLNIIINSLKGRRIVQPLGIKKHVTEDVDDVEAVIYNELEDEYDTWEFETNDWYSRKNGNELTGFIPSPPLIELSKKIF